MKKLIDRLQVIARKNNDSFLYRIDLEPRGAEIRYCFKVFERAERHELLSGTALTLEGAVANADADVVEACKSWGYEV